MKNNQRGWNLNAKLQVAILEQHIKLDKKFKRFAIRRYLSLFVSMKYRMTSGIKGSP